jgi:RNA polymerase sigma-70 factor (ECF subfamily)
MYNTSYRILNHSAEAEDAMQEAFLSAFASISNYDHNIPFGSWLKRIVINKAIDQFRKKKEFTFPDDKNNEMYESNAEEWTSDDYSEKEKQEIITAIHQAICTLPDGYRIIFSLYHLEGYDHQEIASITGISEPASRSQLTRARKQLRERLGNNKLIMKYRKCYG